MLHESSQKAHRTVLQTMLKKIWLISLSGLQYAGLFAMQSGSLFRAGHTLWLSMSRYAAMPSAALRVLWTQCAGPRNSMSYLEMQVFVML